MGKIKPLPERRQSVRFRILSLMKHAAEPDVITFQVENIQNISRGGLAFFTEQQIKEGVTLKLHFLPPNREKPVEARGKVVRCPESIKKEKAFEVGIQFIDVSEDAKLAILELEDFYLENQKKKQS
jgi:hypothetical protein